MKDEILQTVVQKIDLIAAKLGNGVEHFWPIFIRQVYIDSFISIIVFVFCASVLCFLSVLCYKKRHQDDMPLEFVGFVVFIIATIVSFAIFIMYGFSFLNPEYWALQDVISKFK